MDDTIKCTINGNEYTAKKGKYIIDVARENNIYIPSLCNVPGVKPQGSCRICTVKVNGRLMTSCTTPVSNDMEIETDSPELQDLRKSIVELLFVDGNHFCPGCEKSGRCELQALAYIFKMDVPRYSYRYTAKPVDAKYPGLLIDHNRCVLCKRCIRAFSTKDGKKMFAFNKRGHTLQIFVDEQLADNADEETIQKAMDICPVGAIIRKEKGFDVPIGQRKYDKNPIGSDITQ